MYVTVDRVQQVRSSRTGATWWALKAGRTAIFAGLHGKGFYQDIQDRHRLIFEYFDVDRIIVEVPIPHLRLMKSKLKNDVDIIEVCELDYGEIHLIECELRLKHGDL